MKFIEVSYNDLKLGTKYLIINQMKQTDQIYIGIFNGYCNHHTIREISYWGKAYISYLTNYNKNNFCNKL